MECLFLFNRKFLQNFLLNKKALRAGFFLVHENRIREEAIDVDYREV